jgi:hypothetical protein
MKTFKYLILLSAVFVLSCNKEKDGPQTLIGKWKLFSSSYSEGGPMITKRAPTDNKYYVQFNSDGRLEGTSFAEYKTYSVKDSVTLVFKKSDNVIQNYAYIIKGNTLTLGPAGPIYCIEGCSSTFIKVKE